MCMRVCKKETEKGRKGGREEGREEDIHVVCICLRRKRKAMMTNLS